METREYIVNNILELRKQIRELNSKLEKLDYDTNLAESKKYEGKYYIEVQNEHHNEWKRIIYVWSIDEKSSGLNTIGFNYHKGQDDYFGIEDKALFSPVPDPDDTFARQYKEITEEEFVRHYKEVLKRINKIIKISI